MVKFITPTREQVNYVKEVLETKFWVYKEKGPDYYEQFFGLLGETIICDMYTKKRTYNTSCTDGFFDIDFEGKTVDVKTRGIKVPNKKEYWNSVFAEQIGYKVDYYLFLVYREDIGKFQIVGWMSKEEFLKKAKLHKPGDRPNCKKPAYEIRDLDLRKWNEFKKVVAPVK